MNRRDFLKAGSLMSAFGYFSATPLGNILNSDIETSAAGKVYRATNKGKIMVSSNKGKSWELHTQFGPGYTILDIFTARDKRLYVHIGHKRVKFHLALTKDGTAWMAQAFKTTPKPRG